MDSRSRAVNMDSRLVSFEIQNLLVGSRYHLKTFFTCQKTGSAIITDFNFYLSPKYFYNQFISRRLRIWIENHNVKVGHNKEN